MTPTAWGEATMDRATPSDARLVLLNRWVREDLGFSDGQLVAASADASFRRYFRLTRGAESYIVMDAPPDKESLAPFLRVASLLADMGLNVPLVLARHAADGLLLLSDLGSSHYLDALNAARDSRADGEVDRLYDDALTALATLQTRGRAAAASLPPYDARMLGAEMELLPEWFLSRHLGLAVTPAERSLLDRTFAALSACALEQPTTFVHRDYHSRNLMVQSEDNPGIIDFQDAVAGAVTYDLVSLLKDCYVAWPATRVRAWALGFRERLLRLGFAPLPDEREFLRWFDWVGLQRHIKVLGIFCRLHYRDAKPRYLNDLPRILAYVQATAGKYPETAEFAAFLADRVVPVFASAQARALA
jgi:aminoglycoside/choline kinase family phosphotransferase